MDPSQAVSRLRAIAGVLLPGDDRSPAATDLVDLEALLGSALAAVGREAAAVETALAALPPEPSWADLRAYSETAPAEFEVLSSVVAGAYFMSTAVLDSIGYPHGPRHAARNDLVVDELETGILEPVMERESMVRRAPA